MEWILTLSQTIDNHMYPQTVTVTDENRDKLVAIMDSILSVNETIGMKLMKEEER